MTLNPAFEYFGWFNPATRHAVVTSTLAINIGLQSAVLQGSPGFADDGSMEKLVPKSNTNSTVTLTVTKFRPIID